MSVAAIIALVTALLPEVENIASIFIHNPNSKHTFTLVTGEANTIAAVAQAVTTQPALQAATPAPASPAA